MSPARGRVVLAGGERPKSPTRRLIILATICLAFGAAVLGWVRSVAGPAAIERQIDELQKLEKDLDMKVVRNRRRLDLELRKIRGEDLTGAETQELLELVKERLSELLRERGQLLDLEVNRLTGRQVERLSLINSEAARLVELESELKSR